MTQASAITEADILRGIAERPDEDYLRLEYADWLEEQDQPERAEFVRAQCRLVEIEREMPQRQFFHGLLLERDRLQDRERALFAAHAGVWWPGERVTLDPATANIRVMGPWLIVRRGLPAEWVGTCGAWCGRIESVDTMTNRVTTTRIPGVGPAVVRAHPYLRAVRLTDKEPESTGGSARWFGSDDPEHLRLPDRIPMELYRLLPSGVGSFAFGGFDPNTYYATPADAHAALSAAALARARAR
jgi:uncharacterized protein (TIGR02996 family)